MMIVDPQSRSRILRATRILVASITAAEPGPWTPMPPNLQERRVTLSLKLEEVVKGPVTQRPGDVIEIGARQVKSALPWGPMPGVWSNSPIDPGTRVVAFGKVDSDDAAVTLGDSGCDQLFSPEDALADVHLAAQAESARLDLAHLLLRARAVAPALRASFADYLFARHGSEALESLPDFERLAAFLEDPALGPVARTTLVMHLSTAIDMAEPPRPKHAHRFAITLFRLLAMPEAAPLHDNLVGTYLPNILDLDSAHPPRAEDVFHDHPADRASARAALQRYQGTQSPAALLTWLGP